MAKQVALKYGSDSCAELMRMGFKCKTYYVKHNNAKNIKDGDNEFFNFKHCPLQFATCICSNGAIIQIAFNWSDDSESELLEKGFQHQMVLVKDYPTNSELTTSNYTTNIKSAYDEFYFMNNMPDIYFCTRFWGLAID